MDRAGLLIAGLGILLIASLAVNFLQASGNAAMRTQAIMLEQVRADERADWSAQNESLRTQVADLQVSLAAYGHRLETAQARIEEQTGQLQAHQDALNQTQEQLAQSRQALANQTQTTQSLRREFEQLQSDLNGSMAFFRDNADLPATNPSAKGLVDRVMEDCVDGQKLNLACINYVLERTATIHYRIDTDNASRPTNRFQTINQTFAAGGGDCKDYSLLLKAILNSARARETGLRLIAWRAAQSGRFQVYPKESLGEQEKYWYYDDAQAVDLGALDNESVWVVCFPYGTLGHCTVAVGGTPGREGAPPDLAGARVFEPQDGGYMGTVGREFSVCEPQTQSCWSRQQSILLIVGDEDLYTTQSRRWTGYGQLLGRLEKLAQAD